MQNISESMEVIHLSDPCDRIIENYALVEKVKGELQNVTLPIIEEEGHFIVDRKGLSALRGCLNEQLTELQARRTPQNGWIQSQRQVILKQLHQTQNILEDLDELDQRRQLLKPFSLNGKAFPHLDQDWQSWEARIDSTLANITWSLQHLDSLDEEIMDLLDEGQNLRSHLEQEIEKVRAQSSRLFFLSVTDIMDIMATYEDAKNLDKLAECVFQCSDLEVSEKQEITGLQSNREVLQLKKSISLKQKIWELIGELEEGVSEAVKQNGNECLKATEKKDVLQLMEQFIQQSLLYAINVRNTFQTEEALKKGKVEEHQQRAREEIRKYTQYLASEDLSQKDRNNLLNFIIYALHQRDVAERLRRANASPESIEWLVQARMYPREQGNAFLQIAQFELPLTYEYVGNRSRLVITPLTDKAYVTLCSAAVMNQIGSNIGLAGTGKTETSKDLSALLGRLTYVINSSYISDCRSISAILQGSARTGAWVILDEVQSLSVEGLSVLAQQLKLIFAGLSCEKQLISFEGKDGVGLKSTFALFGSVQYKPNETTDLIEPFKEMMRINTLLVPDFQIITQAMFCHEGFSESERLAKLVAQVFELAKATFTQQHFYDFGLRAIKQLTRHAGQVIRQRRGHSEASIIRSVIEDTQYPKLIRSDARLLEQILDSLFEGTSAVQSETTKDESMTQKLKEEFLKEGITSSDYLVEKAHQLLMTVQQRHGVGLVGEAFSGKSLVIKAAANAIGCKVKSILPKAMAEEELYGRWNKEGKFEDGELTAAIREFTTEETEEPRWILLDGPVDPEWVEPLNTVLDDNKKLLLPSHEMIPLKGNMRLIFDMDNVKHSTPAFVSRLGIISFEEEQSSWAWRVQSYLASSALSKDFSDLEETIGLGLNFMKSAKSLLDLSDHHLTLNVLRLLEAQLKQGTGPNDSLLFAMVWSLGSLLAPEERSRFDTFVRSLRFFSKTSFPKKASVFEVTLRREGHKDVWKEWLDEDTSSKIAPLSPTLQMASQMEVMSLLVAQGTPVMLVGPTATGKTAAARSIARRLQNSMNTAEYELSKVSSTQATKAFFSQAKPKKNNKSLLFLDSLNLTGSTKYESNPAHQAVRHFLLSLSEEPQEVSLMAAMDPTVDCQVSPSLLGHFAVIGFPELREESNYCVLSTITDDSSLIDASLQSFSLVSQKVSSANWNLKDLESILRGVSQAQTEEQGRVWAHEAYHVFSDRLKEQAERAEVRNAIKEVARSHFETEIEVDSLVWAGIGPKDFSAYEEKLSWQSVRKEAQEAMAAVGSEEDIAMLLIDQVLEHFLRISRALRNKRSHLLLMTEDKGVSKRLTQLVSEINRTPLYELNKQNWKNTLERSKENGEQSVVLIEEGDDGMMSTLNSIVGNKQASQDFMQEQGALHVVTVASRGLSRHYSALQNKTTIDYFPGLSRESLTILATESLLNTELEGCAVTEMIEQILEESSEKVTLKTVMDQMNCLKAVYREETQELNEQCLISKEILSLLQTNIKQGTPKVTKSMKDIAQIKIPRKKEEDEISEAESIRSILTTLTNAIQDNVNLSDFTELKALSSPPVQVAMVLDAVFVLIDKSKTPIKPSWAHSRKEMANPKELVKRICSFNPDTVTASKFKKLQKVTKDFSFTPESLAKVSAAVKGMGEWVLGVRDYLVSRGIGKEEGEKAKEEEGKEEKKEDKILEEVSEEDEKKLLELMEKGKSMIESVIPADITELKSVKNPTEVAKIILEGLCHMFQIKPVRSFNQTTMKYTYDYWPASSKLLSSSEFLKNLIQFDKDNVSPQVCQKVRKILDDPKCSEQRAKNCSKALSGIRGWMEGVVSYSTLREQLKLRQETSLEEQAIETEEGQKEEEEDVSKDEIKLSMEEEKGSKEEMFEKEGAAERLDQCISALRTVEKKRIHNISQLKARVLRNILERQKKGLSESAKTESLQECVRDSVVSSVNGNLTARKQILEEKKTEIEKREGKVSQEIVRILRRNLQSKPDLQLFLSLSEKLMELGQKKQELSQEIEAVEEQINKMRLDLAEVSNYASALLVCVKDLRRLSRFYSFGEEEFIRIVKGTVEEAQEQGEVGKQKMKRQLLERVQRWVNSGLFEEDRFLFSFLLILKLEDHSLDRKEFQFLVQPHGSSSSTNPTNWLSDKTWQELCWLSELPIFTGLNEAVAQSQKEWKKLIERDEPHQYKLPGVWRQRLNEFHFLLVLRVLRPQKLPLAITSLVSNLLGEQFTSQNSESLQELIKRAGCHTPIVLNMKEEARAEYRLTQVAQQLRKQLHVIYSAETKNYKEKVITAAHLGHWVYLANNQQIPKQWCTEVKRVHPGFRVFLSASTSLSDELLHSSVKCTLESPAQFDQILLDALQSETLRSQFEEASLDLRSIIANIVKVHACLCIQQTYQSSKLARIQKFGLQDLHFAVKVVSEMKEKDSSGAHIRHTLGELVYGRKVIEEIEQKAIKATVDHFFSGQASFGGTSPPLDSFGEFKQFCANMVQENEDPLGVISGNQRALFNQQKVKKLLSNAALVLNPSKMSKAATIEAVLNELPSLSTVKPSCSNIQAIQIERVIEAYNRKVTLMRNHLLRLRSRIEDNQILEPKEENELKSLERGEMLTSWRKGVFNYTDRLSDALCFIKNGLRYFQNLAQTSQFQVVDLNYFLDPLSYLRALALCFAMKRNLSLEDVAIRFSVQDEPEAKEADMVLGEVFVEGAGWNPKLKQLEASGFEGETKLTLLARVEKKEEAGSGLLEFPLKLETSRGQTPELMGLVEVGARKEDEEVLRLRGAAFSLHKRI